MESNIFLDVYKEHRVDLVINIFERTYRNVLSEGFIDNLSREILFSFSRRIVIINNVNNISNVIELANLAKERGEIEEYFFVSDNIADALSLTGLTAKDLGRVPFYSDWALVASTIKGSRWFVHWDAEVNMQSQIDWISPSIKLMLDREDIFTCNPGWSKGSAKNSGEIEAVGKDGDFFIGYGFSDQLFLGDRKRMAAKIYKEFAPASLRYPLSHICSPFEQRVDSYMRNHKLKRATYAYSSYTHPEDEGTTYPTSNFKEKGRLLLIRAIVKILRRINLSNPSWKI